MLPYERYRQKNNILDNIDRFSVCQTAVVIFARLRWWGKYNFPTAHTRAIFKFYLLYNNGCVF